jgi:phage terminase Nu1 subunit (DNA packaging protein)
MGRKQLERISQREYARRLGISNELVSRAVKNGHIKKGWDKEAGKIIVEHANVEWGAMYMKTDVTQVLAQPVADEPDNEQGEADYVEDQGGGVPQEVNNNNLKLTERTSFAEAKRVREIIEAQLAALELKEKKGELVSKAQVEKQLFAFGQQIRVSILIIPDRIIDNLLAATNRAEAHKILTDELHAALETLANKEFDFKPRT